MEPKREEALQSIVRGSFHTANVHRAHVLTFRLEGRANWAGTSPKVMASSQGRLQHLAYLDHPEMWLSSTHVRVVKRD